ncbi:hypothetical protein [Gynuella sunshinyii]|uniref:Uncharacterized protein n=1 Tax=Gynuella sunshinyii YC6258 TaxID=1445510 RepID=A0A0C5VHT2_9GAMM|nr:hypothetical protein [Gynuella sunshinyii]AJQ93801.1 hypothetical Protein YC6258_01756 [Gynuella sunshinyii YC6258]
MTPSESEKLRLEHQAAKLFMRWYEKNTGEAIRHIWHNQPQKPDVSCFLQGEKLDIEIAHLYGSDTEAMQILARELDDKTLEELRNLEQTDIGARLLQALNRILANKAEKNYNSQRTWLVIRNMNPNWHRHDIEQLVHRIEVPGVHPFEQIWIVADRQGQSGIVQLYP